MRSIKLRNVVQYDQRRSIVAKGNFGVARQTRFNGHRKNVIPMAAAISFVSFASTYFCCRPQSHSPLSNTSILSFKGKHPIDPMLVESMKMSVVEHLSAMVVEANRLEECVVSEPEMRSEESSDEGSEKRFEVCKPWTEDHVEEMKRDLLDEGLIKTVQAMNNASEANVGSGPLPVQMIAFLALIGDEGTLMQLKQEGLNLNSVDEDMRNTAIQFLIGSEDCRCRSRHQLRGVDILIRLGVDVNLQNRDGATALDMWYARITLPGVFDGAYSQSKKENLAALGDRLLQAGARSGLYQVHPITVAALRGDVKKFKEELSLDPSKLYDKAADGRNLRALVTSGSYMGGSEELAEILGILDQYGVGLSEPNGVDVFIRSVMFGG